MQLIKYFVGQILEWHSAYKFERATLVSVTELRKAGAKLSNGWVVDEEGHAEGTSRMRGGQVVEVFDHGDWEQGTPSL